MMTTKFLLPFIALLALGLASCQSTAANEHTAPSIKGHWIGSVDLDPYPELLHLSYDSTPVLQCFYRGIDLYVPENFVISQNKVSFDVATKGLYGTFTGKIQGDSLIAGFFEVEGRPYPANLVRSAAVSLEEIGPLVGYYEVAPGHLIEALPYPLADNLTALSIIDFNTGKKRVAFPSPDGFFKAGPRMLSPYPTRMSVKANADTLKPSIAFTDGTKQATANRLPDLEHYEDFEVSNGSVKLSCTIAYPNGNGPFPLVILVPGTGEVTRADIYNDYAKTLPFQNVALLSYDKRGCGESSGNQDDVAFATLASDLLAVVKHVKSNQLIQKIGLVGHGQAGFVMPMAASQSKDIAFIVSIAGSALSLEAQEYNACAQSLKASGFDQTDIDEAVAYEKQLFAFLKGKINSKAFQKTSEEAATKPWKDFVTLFSNKRYMDRWKLIYDFDPAPYLKKLQIPFLAVYGEKDFIAPPAQHEPALKEYLPANSAHQILVLKDANHLMMLGEKRGDFQFSEIIGYAPNFIGSVQEWILARTK